MDGLAVQGPEGQVVAVGAGQAHEGHVHLTGGQGREVRAGLPDHRIEGD